MKVIYSCYWGSYLAVVAASLHLGYIDKVTDIFTLPLFNNIKEHELGELIPVGKDGKGRDVYVIGSKKTGKILAKTLDGIAQVYGFSADSVQFVDLNHYYNNMIRLGIFVIRKLKLVSIGTRLVVKGIEKNYERLKDIVQSVIDKPIYREN
ncbi:MAG: DUF3189 family protein [Thermoanaerobacteraceae bacterium]|nr:DUF3189 family protein [Thermoanaerobacteraceae bacterium]